MNIFYLDQNLKLCAIYHCNKHVVKMILEYAQLLYTAIWVICENPKEYLSVAPLNGSGKHGYRPTHQNHPSAIWTRECLENYQWLCQLAMEVCAEYTYRYGKIHSCQVHIEWLRDHPPPGLSRSPDGGITEFRCAMPDQYKVEGDPIKSYRNYYQGDKRAIAEWAPKRSAPDWYNRIVIKKPLRLEQVKKKVLKLTFKRRD
jgi:hypothetical protein